MGSEELTALTALVAGSAALVAGLTQAMKVLVFPASWQTGRAPMVAAAVLSALAVIGAVVEAGLGLAPATVTAGLTAWLTVYTAAVGTHQTVAKAGRVLTGTTNPSGPDAP